MRHADLQREATAVIVKAASALLYDAAVWHLVWVCERVGVCCGGVSDAMGSKNTCKTCSTDQVFRLDPPVDPGTSYNVLPTGVADLYP